MNIVISGTVGVGKTTIVNLLNKELSNRAIKSKINFEINDHNPYLSFYYKDRPNWSFLIQLDFLLQRFNAIIKNQTIDQSNESISIYDRHFLDDFVFTNTTSIRNDMSTVQINVYHQISNSMLEILDKMERPNHFILLKADFETVLSRIKARNREEELVVDNEYWADLYNQYYINPKIQTYFKQNSYQFQLIDSTTKSPSDVVAEILKLIS